MNVVKRDGKVVEFNSEKIKQAITKSAARVNEMSDSDIDRITEIVVNKCERTSGDRIGVEEIQDLVEDTLLKSKFNRTAKSYILFRDMRTRNRDNKSKLLKDIAKKLNGTNIVNQNANLDEASFGGRKGEAANELMKWFALNNCMSKKSRENHLNNEIYIHDLDHYAVGSHNCLSIPFDDLLANGFNTR
jgi:ribonucleoside-triphosphate reductase